MRLYPPPSMTTAVEVRFHATANHADDPIVVPVTLSSGVPYVDETQVPDGRWYPVLHGTTSAAAPVSDNLDRIDLPNDPTLVVSAERIARKAGIPLPLTADQRETITDAIRDAQDAVTTYLGRQIVPTLRTETGRWPWGETWNLVALGDDDLLEIVSVTAEVEAGQPTGFYTLTYRCGLDARNDPALRPIRSYVEAHVMNSPEFLRLWKVVTKAKGEVRSQSAEGQSVTYAAPTLAGSATTGTKPGDLTPGALPTLASLDYWRVAGRRVHQGPSRASQWPFYGDRW